ncbi:Ger(x)C family spore germination protein [Paenibacillus chartarius]|uniref:Ger(X)C family spore germination protein n=1 Tax=Paenibacillus chartarius TaxID=747481 RepID=A0ABV6DKV0_9BACL
MAALRNGLRRGLSAFLLTAASLLLTGCWDRVEINDMAFALTSALDKEPDGSYRVTYMFPLPGQMGGGGGGGGGTGGGTESYYIDSETGPSIRDASSKLQQRMSRLLFISHRRTIVVGEELAKEGISDLFDSVPRMPESRLSAYFIVSKGPAWKLINAKPKFERFPAETIRELSKSPGAMNVNAKNVAMALSFDSDPIIIYMGEKASEKASVVSKEIQVLGYAQFKGDKMVGVYEGSATQGLMWLRDEVKSYSVTLKDPKEQKPIVVQVERGSTNIIPHIKGDDISISIDLDIRAKVRENFSSLDMNKTADLHTVESLLSAQVKTSVEQVIAQMQKKSADSAQFGQMIWRHYPAIWNAKLEDQWDEQFPKVKFTVSAKSGITEVGLINQNVTKRSR